MKYTERDYKALHCLIIEDMIESCLSKWFDPMCDPLEARVHRNLAYALEDLRHAEDCLIKGSLNIWVSAANEEASRQNTPKGVTK
ncbi:MAG: hypothetical protein ACYTBY_07040 [Planctomycetota bacterium]|jgi:hypothetical protein